MAMCYGSTCQYYCTDMLILDPGSPIRIESSLEGGLSCLAHLLGHIWNFEPYYATFKSSWNLTTNFNKCLFRSPRLLNTKGRNESERECNWDGWSTSSDIKQGIFCLSERDYLSPRQQQSWSAGDFKVPCPNGILLTEATAFLRKVFNDITDVEVDYINYNIM